MLGRVKKFLGIEGIKVELEIPEEVSVQSGVVQGKLHFSSMNPQTVESAVIIVIEKYSRGRKRDKLTDEYELGRIEIELNEEINPEEITSFEFEVPFDMMISEMDEFQSKNILYRGIAKAAKWYSKVSSEFRIEVEAKVKGTLLSPFDRKAVNLKY
ncbi:MAG: sporulation protein [Bacteroidia bacterium]|nr:sporulation protein [Bacteroidia bacterium]